VTDLVFDSLTVRNFLRYGDRPTTIDISGKRGLVVIRGENGHGKSSIFDALSFALTGKPMRQFPMGALVNNVNKKKLEVTVDLRKGPWSARISRGQKPGYVKFWKKPSSDQRDIESDEFSLTAGRGSTDTAREIENFLGFDNALFCAMIAGSTRRPSFLSCESSVQKAIVERLFGFSILQDDAAAVKLIREADESAASSLRSDRDHRERQAAAVAAQVAGLVEKSRQHAISVEKRSDALSEKLSEMRSVDLVEMGELARVVEELTRAAAASENEVAEAAKAVKAAARPAASARERLSAATKALDTLMTSAQRMGSTTEADLDEAARAIARSEEMSSEIAELSEAIGDAESSAAAMRSEAKRARSDAAAISDECPTCGQAWPDVEQRAIRCRELESAAEAFDRDIAELTAAAADAKSARSDKIAARDALVAALRWSTAAQVESARRVLASLAEDLEAAEREVVEADESAKAAASVLTAAEERHAELSTELASLKSELSSAERPAYCGFATAERLLSEIESVESQLAELSASQDPYLSGIAALEASIPDQIDQASLVALESRVASSRQLERLLVHKDSQLRAAMLSRFLPSLNQRVTGYLDHLGLPYAVRFTSDLEVQILDGDDEVSALSGGEEERLAMALSWSFRDLYEEIHGVRVCFSAIDERLDSGMDASGADAAVELLRKASLGNGRSVWLVTHRAELENHADHVVRIRRNNRFSEIDG